MMRFHEICGSNIVFSCDRQKAERKENSYDHGIVYSNKPLRLGEIIQVKIEQLEQKWAGALRFGVTTISPLNEFSKSLRAATDILNSDLSSNYWVWSGPKLYHNKKEFSVMLNLHSLVVNDVVGIQIRGNGDFHIYQHGLHVQKIEGKLPVQNELYVIVDVYGQVRKITIEEDAGTLKHICRRFIRTILNEDDIEKLHIPKTLKMYLKNYSRTHPIKHEEKTWLESVSSSSSKEKSSNFKVLQQKLLQYRSKSPSDESFQLPSNDASTPSQEPPKQLSSESKDQNKDFSE